MLNAGILPGDLVVVRQQQTCNQGEIVVAMIDDEATVKRFSRKGGHVWLLPGKMTPTPRLTVPTLRFSARLWPWCGSIESFSGGAVQHSSCG